MAQTPFDKSKLISSLLEQGVTDAEIAKTLGITRAEVQSYKAKINQTKAIKLQTEATKAQAPKGQQPLTAQEAEKLFKDILKAAGPKEQGPKQPPQQAPKLGDTSGAINAQVNATLRSGEETPAKAETFLRFAKRYAARSTRRSLETNFGLMGAWAADKIMKKDTKEKKEVRGDKEKKGDDAESLDLHAKALDASVQKIGVALGHATTALAKQITISGEKQIGLLKSIAAGLSKIEGGRPTAAAPQVISISPAAGPAKEKGGIISTILTGLITAGGALLVAKLMADKAYGSTGKPEDPFHGEKVPPTPPQTPTAPSATTPDDTPIPKLDIKTKTLDYKISQDITFKAPKIIFKGGIQGIGGGGAGGGGAEGGGGSPGGGPGGGGGGGGGGAGPDNQGPVQGGQGPGGQGPSPAVAPFRDRSRAYHPYSSPTAPPGHVAEAEPQAEPKQAEPQGPSFQGRPTHRYAPTGHMNEPTQPTSQPGYQYPSVQSPWHRYMPMVGSKLGHVGAEEEPTRTPQPGYQYPSVQSPWHRYMPMVGSKLGHVGAEETQPTSQPGYQYPSVQSPWHRYMPMVGSKLGHVGAEETPPTTVQPQPPQGVAPAIEKTQDASPSNERAARFTPRPPQTVPPMATGTLEEVAKHTTQPGATMEMQGGVENALGKMHPAYINRSFGAIQALNQAGFNNVGISSGYRPPGFMTNSGRGGGRVPGAAGSAWSFRSMHGLGLAGDWQGVPDIGSKRYDQFADIMSSHGLYNPYVFKGANGHWSGSAREWNHWQILPNKTFPPDHPIWKTVGARGPLDTQKMWEASGVPVPRTQVPIESVTQEGTYEDSVRNNPFGVKPPRTADGLEPPPPPAPAPTTIQSERAAPESGGGGYDQSSRKDNDPPPTSKRDHAFQDEVPGINDKMADQYLGMGE